MGGKNNFKALREREARRVYRCAIKRLSVGVASVAVSASLLFVSNGVVAQAAETDAAITPDNGAVLDGTNASNFMNGESHQGLADLQYSSEEGQPWSYW